MKKVISLALFPIIFLTSCGAAVTDTPTTEKKPFYIETKTVADFPSSYIKEKSGRLVGSSTIALTSQGIGRVASIPVKE